MTRAGKGVFSGSVNKRFVDVAQQLRLQIRNGQFMAGDQLPAIGQLASDFGVAVVTIRHALAMLEDEELVIRRQGLGTFVREVEKVDALRLPLDADWSEIRSFWKGSKPKIIEEGYVDNCPSLTPHDQRGTSRFYRMRRVHSSAKRPYTVAEIYIEESIYKFAPDRFRKEIALHVLADLLSSEPLDAREIIRIDAAGTQVAKLLEIAVGAPIVIAHRTVRRRDGEIVYVGTPIYPGEIVQLERSFLP